MNNKKYKLEDLKLGMKVTDDQLSDIYDTYMLIAYDSMEDEAGTLVFIGKEMNKEYDEIVSSGKRVCPIYISREEAEELYSYDE